MRESCWLVLHIFDKLMLGKKKLFRFVGPCRSVLSQVEEPFQGDYPCWISIVHEAIREP